MNKGARVKLCTTNGGEIVVILTHDYKPTYAVTVERLEGGYFTVSPCRIKSIEAVTA